MGAGSLLALMARHSLLPARHMPKLVAADIALIDYERPTHLSHAAQLAEEQPQPGAGALHLLSSFHVELQERLQLLQIQGIGNAHLNWLLDALASTLSTHSSLQMAFSAAASSTGPSSAKHRADEVLNMLDVCTALKQVADDMDRQSGCLQHALESVGQALNSEKPLSSGRLRGAAHKLSACLLPELPHTNVLSITGKHYKPLAEARSSLFLAAKRELQSAATSQLADPAAVLLSQALDGALLTSLLVLAAAVSSLAPPSSRRGSGTITSAGKMIIKYFGCKSALSTPWAALLRQLHHDLKQEDMSAAGGSLFRELQGLHSAATKLHATITTPGAHPIEVAVVKQSVESLRKRSQEAHSCISMMRKQLASFFQALIALRLALLDS